MCLVLDQFLWGHSSRVCDISCFVHGQSPWNTGQTHHLSYQGGPKSSPHIFFVLTNLDCFDLGTSLQKLCIDVAYIDNWPRAIYLFDRQIGRLTDRQTGRQTYIFCRA